MRSSIKQSGLAAIELLIAVASLFLAFWLAMLVVTHSQSGWRWVWGALAFVVSYAGIFVCLFFGLIISFGRFSDWLDKRRQPHEKKHDA